ncbi:protein kinase family protein, partial [Kitasatospora sp. NPDC018614]
MAERSTAAVDVADNSGDEPLTAEADQSTADGVAQNQERDTDIDEGQGNGGTERPGTRTSPPELHSGHKLAGRYRLEECVTRLDGFSSWRAVDEKLRRAVGVHILPAFHSRARSVLAAARSSALLGDPRFVQVLDAVEENDLVYVVHEWLPDATELTTLLSAGPLEPHDAYQLVSQVASAMATAHREGLAHLRLNPNAVLRASTGQWRIRGLAVNA